MFVNYVRDDQRSSPFNLAAARLILGGWILWKTVWYDWSRHVETPYRAFTGAGEWAIPTSMPWILTVEKWLLLGLVCLFIVGYRIQLTAAASSLLLAHLATVRKSLVASGETSNLYIGALFVLFFALYAETDELSVDGIRRRTTDSVDTVSSRLTSTASRRFSMPSLKYSLLLLALLYFSTGLSKIIDHGGHGFASPDNLTRLIRVRSYLEPWHDLQLLVVEYPILATLGGAGTLLLELGFLVAVLLGVAVTPFIIGLILFTFSNFVLLGILFVDNLFFFVLFVSHDRVYERIVRDRDIVLVFDDDCSFCARALYPFKLLDINDTVTFLPRSETPERYREQDGVDFDRAMYVFYQGTAYEGYHAFRELLRQFRLFFWAVWLMRLPVIERVGIRTYRYVAANRGSQLEC